MSLGASRRRLQGCCLVHARRGTTCKAWYNKVWRHTGCCLPLKPPLPSTIQGGTDRAGLGQLASSCAVGPGGAGRSRRLAVRLSQRHWAVMLPLCSARVWEHRLLAVLGGTSAVSCGTTGWYCLPLGPPSCSVHVWEHELLAVPGCALRGAVGALECAVGGLQTNTDGMGCRVGRMATQTVATGW